MKPYIFVIVIALSTVSPGTAFAVTHTNRSVQSIQPPAATADCLYFTLAGVTEADPVLQGNAWFAVPRAQYGFAEIYALLLSARISGTAVNVQTTGQTTCGYAAIIYIWIP